jgi:hypothetical protein
MKNFYKSWVSHLIMCYKMMKVCIKLENVFFCLFSFFYLFEGMNLLTNWFLSFSFLPFICLFFKKKLNLWRLTFFFLVEDAVLNVTDEKALNPLDKTSKKKKQVTSFFSFFCFCLLLFLSFYR